MKDEGGSLKAERVGPEELRSRTKRFSLRIMKLYCLLPKTILPQVIGKQLLRSGTSVGAHYREAARSRSDAEFISKLEGGLQELDESIYWIELLMEAGIVLESNLKELTDEADELMAIFTTCVKKVKARRGGRRKDEGGRMKAEG